MIKQVASTFIRTLAPMPKNLLKVPKAPFATNPFNNPYGDKTKNM